MKSRISYLLGLCIVVIIILLALLAWPKSSSEQAAIQACIDSGGSFDVATQECTLAKPASTDTADIYAPASMVNQIKVTSPLPNAKLGASSPMTVTGKALGSWFFEASFPIKLEKADGTVISTGHVTAQGEWMTTSFVDFTGSLSYPAQPHGSKGYLVLQKDNESDLPQNAGSAKIPVIFQ